MVRYQRYSFILLIALGCKGKTADNASPPTKTAKAAQTAPAAASVSIKVTERKDNVTAADGASMPSTGNKFVSFHVTIENHSATPWSANYASFELPTGHGTVISPGPSSLGVMQPALGAGDIAPGQSMDGWISLQVSTATDVATIKLSYRHKMTDVLPVEM